jgi:hypothetical protein
MPSGFPISHDPQRDHLWSRVVDLVDQHREPGRSPHQADRDEESITWIIGGPDGSEAHVTVRERPFRDVSFRRSRGEPGVWAELEVLRVGLSTLLGRNLSSSVRHGLLTRSESGPPLRAG